MTDVRLRGREVLVDARPRLVRAGEIHYFRLRREDWAGRLQLLKDAGADTVATYIPWVVHERGDGTIDLTGRTDPTLDLGAFLDLAAQMRLRVLLRPGPFIMAEMAGEGVPDRIRHEHPESLPIGWEGRPGLSADLDYLAPAYLAEVERWYRELGEVVASRMAPHGGPVIAVQLDNEIGMLAWVSNTPQLTDRACAELAAWLADRYGAAVADRYPGLSLTRGFAEVVRSPAPEWTRPLRLDLGRFFRSQFGRYATALSRMAAEAGMGGVPFVVNIHGTTGGSGASFPIGLSQVVETYAGRPQMAAGSDHYLGDLTLRTAADLHLMNAFMTAAAPDQPGMTLEFEAGRGDYGDDLFNEVDPSAVILKTRLSLAQGHRLLNYYLFAGGTNFVADPPRVDGTSRFAITGERHGFSAPVDPEGQPGTTYASTAEALRLTARLERWLADSVEEHDDVAIGMILDDYLTEYRAPGDADDGVGELEYGRGAGPRGLLGRVLLTLGYRYGAIDLQREPGPDPWPHLVVLGSPIACDRAVQERLATHVRSGGALLLLGSLPTTELDGTPCTVLADTLGIQVVGDVRDEPGRFTSVVEVAGWGHGTERRVGRTQLYEAPGAQVLLTEAMSGLPAGVLATAQGAGGQAGSAVVLGCDFGADLALFATALARLGVTPGLRRETSPGLISTTTRASDGSRLLHLLNVSGSRLRTAVEIDDESVLGGVPITLSPRTGVALPIGVRIAGRSFATTAEIERVERDHVLLAAPLDGTPRRAWIDGAEVPVDDDGRVGL
ncbi:beta-galactosidase [Pseudactinotalea sp.]|uniref:beta-galactosidase n=1 Tax=Pseudactinotalea sp. TaxID=1926260 RepID=UPI003B3BE9A5